MKILKKILNRTGFLLAVLALLGSATSCRQYLDIVPDGTVTLEDYFSRKEMAWNTLTKVYSFLPEDPYTHQSTWLLGDEWIGRPLEEYTPGRYLGLQVMGGRMQGIVNPLLGTWRSKSDDGNSYGGKLLYSGIRNANIFIEYIDQVEDMSEADKKEWKAQVKFLKAYFHFLLLRQYGPIIIADEPVSLDALAEDLFQARSKVDDCFDFILRLMNEAIPDLKARADLDDLGQVDRAVAMAIKARVAIYRASPFWNGNREYYSNFLDHDGQPFFPLTEKPEKWQDALTAVNEAIKFCEDNDVELYDLYNSEKTPYSYDREDFAANKAKMTALYNLRLSVTDPWNKELIWGKTYDYNLGSPNAYDFNGDDILLATASQIRLPSTPDYGSNAGGIGAENTHGAAQSLAASYKMVERYYTKNGLPIDEDQTFDLDGKHEIVRTPKSEELGEWRGILQPDMEIVKLYLDREPRFYANLGITGSYWRSFSYRIKTTMYAGGDGGYMDSRPTDYLCTGIGSQKLVHPESKAGAVVRIVRVPYPIIRMADLYLMQAEALNESLPQPDQTVWNAINKVRSRAGIPNVETAWSSDAARTKNKHTNKEGMREIILQERSIELAFEGLRFWDMHRYKKAIAEFSAPVMGWNYAGRNADDFFVMQSLQSRRFLFRDNLWPISEKEINKNANLIQNPGW
ncbi:MAG: RagB/SusD family nutrient uptake outer membrane protein [Prevotellaceae bacterium]|jgi:hypothetical protein|nr:RagB/SusD family nutrient uptake outer membrane protein [Prevotellaceae bacterium]